MPLNSERRTAMEILRDYFGLPEVGEYWWVLSPILAVEEIDKMHENTNAVMTRQGARLFWSEAIENNFGNIYHISIRIDPGFPFAMPKVFVQEPKIEIDPKVHINNDGSLCLMHSEDYSPHMSILEMRNQAAAWTWCYDVYKHSGEWPAAERPHDDDD